MSLRVSNHSLFQIVPQLDSRFLAVPQKIYTLYQKCCGSKQLRTTFILLACFWLWSKTRGEIAQKAMAVFQRYIGSQIRDTYFMVLAQQARNEVLAEEQSYYTNFLNKSHGLDTNFPHQELIRNTFTLSYYEHTITLRSGAEVTLSCPVFSHASSQTQETYTYVHIGGNMTTADNNINWFYPPIAAFLDKHRGRELPSASFTLLSAYQWRTQQQETWRPETLDEAGYAIARALKAMGKPTAVHATSLGVIYLSHALKYLTRDFFSSLWLDRGPTSLEEARKRYSHGWIKAYGAWLSGWSFDVETALRDWNIASQNTQVIVIGVKHDSHFSDTANLCNCNYLKELQQQKSDKLTVLHFNPPTQTTAGSRSTHHSVAINHFNAEYATDDATRAFFQGNENLAHALIRTSSLYKERDESKLV